MLFRSVDPDFLVREIRGLKRLLAEAESNAKALLDKAEIEAREREVVGGLQRLILEELQHRIKNTLATVGAGFTRYGVTMMTNSVSLR